MADFCPSSSASSTPNGSNAYKISPKVIVASKQNGQLWKKIGLVGSVAVMGGQPVLAQIDGPAGDAIAPPVAADTAPASASIAPAPEILAPVAPPVAVSPEPVAPTFSPAPEPAAAPQPEAVAPQVSEAVSPEQEIPAVSEAPATPVEVSTPQVEIVIPKGESSAEEAVATEETPVEEASAEETLTVEETAAVSVPETAPAVDIVTPEDIIPEQIPDLEDLAAEYGGNLIDPTEYRVGETATPDAPDVFISERSTGCEYKVDAKSLGENCGVAAEKRPTQAAIAAPDQPAARGSINIGPVNISRSGVRFSGRVAAVASREYYNTVAKPLVDLQAGESFVFPLASPSPITSLFGWRWHPIHNDYRFHSGTDLGAPQGTPILATQSGQVTVADYLGGYGLTVILRHNENTLESRYAHMSHILVQSGEWVEQGEVIGLVGSTGNSTGPHLHFELHQLTGQGWAAVSPNEVLKYALANLNNRAVGNPLQALNIMPKAQASPVKAALPKDVKTETLVKDAPHFRPAQPHAQ